jgi:type IV pilus assembly protein PilX
MKFFDRLAHAKDIRSFRYSQRGASLVVSLLMLVAILLLGISAAQIALQGEKASRNDRDRQIAFQAAEAALMDAEMDIENSTAGNSRSALFSETETASSINFTADCNPGKSNAHLGMCAAANPGAKPVWQTVNLADSDDTNTKSVPFGKFTGQVLQTGNGLLPSKPPRYIIEQINYRVAGEDVGATAAKPSYFYRITAIGFGARETTQSVLQTYYRKIDQ